VITFIGEKDIWQLFKIFGIKLIDPKTSEETIAAVNAAIDAKATIIFISENKARLLDNIDHYYNNPNFNIILLPAPTSNQADRDTISYKKLKNVIEKSIGFDILSKKN
jgi:vacuolar-type H+-ATPase subunit F/Vma7